MLKRLAAAATGAAEMRLGMKKTLCILLSAALIFALCACAGVDELKNTELPPLPSAETQTSPAPQTAPAPTEPGSSEPAPAETPAPTPAPAASGESASVGSRVLVYMSKTRDVSYAPDNDELVILDFSYVTPTVRIDDNPAAAFEINEQLGLLDETYYSGTEHTGGKNGLLEAAMDNYAYALATGAELNLEFSSARTVRTARADGGAISFVYFTSMYNGGAQGVSSYLGVSFDGLSGAKLTLGDLGPDREALVARLQSCLVKHVKDDAELYAEISSRTDDPDAAIGALVREGSWYMSGEGLVFAPLQGELQSAASGIKLITVPYSELGDLLYPKYMPPERGGECSLEIVRLGDVENGTVWSIDRLAVSDGEELYLIVHGTAYDVCVSSVNYADHGERFFETERRWYASFMTDCALQLKASVPEGMPDLMISYTDADFVQHRVFLSENGVDGGLVLVDDSIEAVG